MVSAISYPSAGAAAVCWGEGHLDSDVVEPKAERFASHRRKQSSRTRHATSQRYRRRKSTTPVSCRPQRRLRKAR